MLGSRKAHCKTVNNYQWQHYSYTLDTGISGILTFPQLWESFLHVTLLPTGWLPDCHSINWILMITVMFKTKSSTYDDIGEGWRGVTISRYLYRMSGEAQHWKIVTLRKR